MPNRKNRKAKGKKLPTQTKQIASKEAQPEQIQEEKQQAIDVQLKEESISPVVEAAISAVVSFSCIDMTHIIPSTAPAPDTSIAPEEARSKANLSEDANQTTLAAAAVSHTPLHSNKEAGSAPSANTSDTHLQPVQRDTYGSPSMPAGAVKAAVEAVLAGSVLQQASPLRRYSATPSAVAAEDAKKHQHDRPELFTTSSSSSFIHLSHPLPPPPPPPQSQRAGPSPPATVSTPSSQRADKALPPVPKEKDREVKRPDPAHNAPLPASQINPHSRQLPPPPLAASRLDEQQQAARDNQKCIIL
ncbi:hypothetical protein BCR43DRAFT_518358 [Syncephalastrum racemosum]|uniref:Uncharacterized protein n=1 Tax=Syncephalastrum racemosum TaxID=13706 RepID=A0A1X2H0L6_SYNRA|nr:hypothetical protein BCR43DRAFT_518358 [Syncephalastrum racemosum]